MARKTGVPGPGAYRLKENTCTILRAHSAWSDIASHCRCRDTHDMGLLCLCVQRKATSFDRRGQRRRTSNSAPHTETLGRRRTLAQSWPTLATESEQRAWLTALAPHAIATPHATTSTVNTPDACNRSSVLLLQGQPGSKRQRCGRQHWQAAAVGQGLEPGVEHGQRTEVRRPSRPRGR